MFYFREPENILSQSKHFDATWWDMNITQPHVHGVTRPTEQFNLSGTLTQNQRLLTLDRTEKATGVLVTSRL